MVSYSSLPAFSRISGHPCALQMDRPHCKHSTVPFFCLCSTFSQRQQKPTLSELIIIFLSRAGSAVHVRYLASPYHCWQAIFPYQFKPHFYRLLPVRRPYHKVLIGSQVTYIL